MIEPPNDTVAEQCVIGAMMQSAKALNTVIPMLHYSHFYKPTHQWIYAAMVHLAGEGQPVDAVTVGRELEVRGQFHKAGGGVYLATCLEVTPLASHAAEYAQMVLDKAKLRNMAELGEQLKQLAYADTSTSDDVAVLMSQGESFFRAQNEPDGSALSFDDMLESWEKWQESAEGYIPTPWESVNAKLNGGLQRGRLYTIAARPGVGKSVAALQIAANAAHWGFESAFFTLEMSTDEVTSRLVSSGAGVDFSAIMRKRFDLETPDQIDRWKKENRNLTMEVIDRPSISVEQVIAHCRTKQKLDVVCVDYLQLLKASDPKQSREQQVAHMSRSLKIAARELNVAMVDLSQLNRGNLKEGKVLAPTLGNLRESGAIEQDSDVVILLHTDEDDPGIIQFIIAKNRNGRMGTVALGFEGHYQRITG